MGSLPPRGVCELSVAQRSLFVHLCQPGKKKRGASRNLGEETWLDRASARVLYGTLLGGVWSPRDHLAPATAGKPMATGTSGMLQGRLGDSQEGDSKRHHGCSCYSARLPTERGRRGKRGKNFLYSATGKASGRYHLQRGVTEAAGFIALGLNILHNA